MIRLLIVDDQKMVRELLKTYILPVPDLVVVGEAENGKAALERMATLEPDVILMDVEMPGMDGLATTRVLLQHNPNCKVLVVSSHYDDVYFARALRNGARGYLLKTTSATELVEAIQAVSRGFLRFESGILNDNLIQLSTCTVADQAKTSTDEPNHLPDASASLAVETADNLAELHALEVEQMRQSLTVIEGRLYAVERKQTRMQWLGNPREMSRLKSSLDDVQSRSQRLALANRLLSLMLVLQFGFTLYALFGMTAAGVDVSNQSLHSPLVESATTFWRR